MSIERIQITKGTKSIVRFLLHFFMLLILVESFLGGGGRLIDVGALSIRMYFFLLGLILSIICIVNRKRLNKNTLLLLIYGTTTLVLGIFLGISRNNSLSNILVDVRPLIYLYSILYFYFFINTSEEIVLMVKLLKICAFILAISYVTIFILLNTKLMPLDPFYKWASPTEEIIFRSDFAFFYKGFIYMCIGHFFYRWRMGFNSKLAIIIISLSIVLTFTRGFILSLFLVYLLDIFFIQKRSQWFIVVFMIVLTSAPIVWNFVSSAKNLDRATSDMQRIIQITEVFRGLDIQSFFFGKGFGLSIPSRSDLHLEISYLEILYKQGIFGLGFWLFFLLLIFDAFRRASIKNKEIATPFLLSSIFTFVLSFTNPFINNPIGLTIIIISLVCLQKIALMDYKIIID